MLRFMGMHGTPIASPKRRQALQGRRWQEHFLFDFIKQSHLITARHARHRELRWKGWMTRPEEGQLLTRQYIDALSPSNFAMTNPEVFRETVKNHGQNLPGPQQPAARHREGGGNVRVA